VGAWWWFAVFGVTGVILSALYMLWAYERVMWGPITKAVNGTIADLGRREIAVLVPLLALMLVMGLYPKPIIDRIEPSVALMLQRVRISEARIDAAPVASALAVAEYHGSK
jgi:NADH-quinone oxidoreductase subunit M